MNDSIEAYNKTAKEYTGLIFEMDVQKIREAFLNFIPLKGNLLDLGCGPGRDSLYFESQDYSVTALDGSIAMCQIAEQFVRGRIINCHFLDMAFDGEFDGIWACASLLHVESKRQVELWTQIKKALKRGGYAYASYKYSDFEGYRGKKYYLDMTETQFYDMLKAVPGLELVAQWVTAEKHYDDTEQKWLHNIVRRT